ncbi:GntR family transcriptional regulator [Aminobacter sp. AP02]|uniref:GntR family transcriptional regulator n=1 Tax=Aminobacter sp. AP02 TaxID=2135737 RepID=UPI000D7AA3E1|nr:GntR family transcriptional regulator [Aminobacter sp. AP02]PWK68972.1 GntR family transcriptional regulator [Aminobacter sp. AP02]
MPNRYLSPALQGLGAVSLTAPLVGVEAQIYDRLWNAILDRKVRPGTKLSEDEIGAAFSVSRTVIRKVLVILEEQGIINLPANRGAYVAAPTPEEALEVFEASRIIARHVVAELAAAPERLGAEERARLDAHYEMQKQAAAANDYHAMRRLVVEFYLLLALLYGNKTLAAAQERLMMRGAMAITLYQEHLVLWPPHQAHRPLVELIYAGEVEKAVAHVDQLYRTTEASLRLAPHDQEIDLLAILTADDGPALQISPKA